MSLLTRDCVDEVLPGMDDWEWDLDGQQPKWLAGFS